MNLLLLGGNSPHNRDWLAEVERELTPLFEQIYTHQYAHWRTGQGSIDLAQELSQVQQAVEKRGPYGIFAKSAGALLALKGIAEGKLTPKWCVLVGLPLHFAEDNGITAAEWLAANTVPIRILQNTNDPTASFTEVHSFLEMHGSSHISLTELPGDTHDYRDFAAIKTAITSFL